MVYSTSLALVLLVTAAPASQIVETRDCRAARLQATGAAWQAQPDHEYHGRRDIEVYLRLHRDALTYGSQEALHPQFSGRLSSE
jgi:hypothetical protein